MANFVSPFEKMGLPKVSLPTLMTLTHRLDHILVKGSIITEMSIPRLLKILGDAIKQDVLLLTMLR